MSSAHSFSVDLHGLRRYPLAGAKIGHMEIKVQKNICSMITLPAALLSS
jgi:hypothetical protein